MFLNEEMEQYMLSQVGQLLEVNGGSDGTFHHSLAMFGGINVTVEI